jgi:predicted O-methyltransferase YrrM
MSIDQYSFTNNWFQTGAKNVWDQLIPQVKPTRFLEIGSYEGASACYLIDKFSPEKAIEIHCVDTWEGGVEHNEGGSAQVDMGEVETRFRANVKLAKSRAKNNVDVIIHKGMSDAVLAGMFAGGKAGYFDFIYVDGSHQAPDVLCDAILAFRLLRVNGLIAFDDYLWQERLPNGVDPIRCPKPAIDAFTNIYCRKIKIIGAPLYQLYVQKLSD